MKLSERLEFAAWAVDGLGQGNSVAETIREAAELARRFEDAPKVEITECNQIKGAKDFDYGDLEAAVQKFKVGQRVRLVPDSPTPPDPGHEQDR